MKRLVRAELYRLRWTRSLWALPVAGVVVSVVAGIILVTSFPEDEVADRLSMHGPLRFGISNLGLFVTLLGIRVFGDEVQHHTLANTLLRWPARRDVLAAKAIVVVGAAVAMCASIYVLVVPATLVARDARGFAMALDAGATATLFGRNVLAMSILGLVGLTLSAAIRNRTLALVAWVLWVGFGETILGGLLRAPEYMPGNLVQSLMSGGNADAVDPTRAAGLLVAILAACSATALISIRRDVD